MLKRDIQVTRTKHKDKILWEDKVNNRTSDALDNQDKYIK